MKLEHFANFMHDVCVGQFNLAKQTGVVVAVSGGRDSIALLHGLVTMDRIHQMQLRLVIAHLNHQTRGAESDEDATFVAQLSDQLGLTCVSKAVNAPQMANDEHLSIEQVGRKERYRLFTEVATAHGCQHVALGHHAEDNVETVLHRIVRGTGLRGLAGIPATRIINHDPPITLMRPLLTVRRSQIDELIQQNHLPFRDDPSNQQPQFTRNKIRHELLPMLRQEFNPLVDDALLRLAQMAGGTDAVITATAREVLDDITVERDSRLIALDVPALLQHATVVQREIIRQAMTDLSIPLQRIGYEHLIAVAGLLNQPGSGQHLDLPGDVVVRKRYDHLVIEHQPSAGRQEGGKRIRVDEIDVNEEGNTELPAFDAVLHCQRVAAEAVDFEGFCRRKAPTDEMVDHGKLHLPLCVRSRREGDRFQPLGGQGSKKVSDFLAELKIPIERRDTTPILCDQQGPIWIIPYRIDERTRVDGNSKLLLHLTLHPWPAP